MFICERKELVMWEGAAHLYRPCSEWPHHPWSLPAFSSRLGTERRVRRRHVAEEGDLYGSKISTASFRGYLSLKRGAGTSSLAETAQLLELSQLPWHKN